MSAASKLFGIWAINKTVSTTTPLLLRLLTGMAVIAMGTMIAALLIALLLAGGVWLAYTYIVTSGMDQQSAILIVGALLLTLLVALILALQNYYCKLRISLKKWLNGHLPLGRRISPVVNAFMEGLDSGPSSR